MGLWNTLTASLQMVSPTSNEYNGYDTKQSNGWAPVTQELWGIQNIPSLSLLPCPL